MGGAFVGKLRRLPRESGVQFRGLLSLERSAPERYRREFPSSFASLIRLAQDIRQHNFTLLGRTLRFDGPIAWHRDVASGKEWKRRVYSEIALHYEGSPDDPKNVWELNRHQHFVTLAQAAYLSGDRVFFDELVAQWLDWIEENPCGVGINWASPLEAGIRLISWTLAYQLSEPLFSPAQKEEILHSVHQHTAFLAGRLSTDKVVRTNHLIGECAGLFIASTCFRFSRSESWQKQARTLLEGEIIAQVNSDGGIREQSASYHRFEVELLLAAFLAARSASLPFSSRSADRLQGMIRWLEFARTPDGGLPQFGDCDNGRGFLVAPMLDFWNADGLPAVAKSLFGSYSLIGKTRLNEETFWLVSERDWETLRRETPGRGRAPLEWLPESGHLFLTHGGLDEKNFCFVRCGAFGLGGSGFAYHSHNDLFAPIVYFNGIQILADTGTSLYGGNQHERDYLRSAAAHNSTFAGGWKFFRPRKVLGWEEALDGTVVEQRTSGSEILLACRYNRGGIRYQRNFEWKLDTPSLCVEDVFEEETPSIQSYFHLGPGLAAEAGDGRVAILRGNETLASMTFPKHLSLRIEKGWISRSYGTKEDSVLIHFTWNAGANEPMRFILSGPPETTSH